MPASAPLGAAVLSVEVGGEASKPFSISIVASQIGLFSLNGNGWGPGLIDNLSPDGRRRPNEPQFPAKPGQMVELTATGLGDADKVDVNIGGRAALGVEVHHASVQGRDSIRFRVPPDAPFGCYVPVFARATGVDRSNTVTLAIADGSSHCEIPPGWPMRVETKEQKTGILGVVRTIAFYGADQPNVTADEAFASFFDNVAAFDNGSSGPSNRLLLIPPIGTCTSFSALYNSAVAEFSSIASAIANPGDVHTLDAGAAFTIASSGGSRSIPITAGRQGVFWTHLGLDDPTLRRKLPLFLDDPLYRFSSKGGADVQAISVTVPGIPTFQWTNRDALEKIQRSTGASIEWSGASEGALILIVAGSFDPYSTAGGIAYCAAKAEAGHLRIPPELFEQFPAAVPRPGPLRNGLAVFVLRSTSSSAVRGLDLLHTVSAVAYTRRSEFQ